MASKKGAAHGPVPTGLARRRAERAAAKDEPAAASIAKKKVSGSPGARQTVEPGTWVGIPLGDDRFAFARVVALRPPPANVATVVVHRSEGTRESFDPERAATSALRVPPFLLLGSWMLERWPVLAKPTSAFAPASTEIDFDFAPGTPGVWRRSSARTSGPVGPVLEPEVARGLVSAAMMQAEAREIQVRAAVASDASWSVGDPDPFMVRVVDAYLAQRND